MDADATRGARARIMMENKLRLYLWWKGKLGDRKQDGRAPFGMPEVRWSNEQGAASNDADAGLSEALKKKDREKRERAMNRRRVRGGAPAPAASKRADSGREVGDAQSEAETIAALCV